MTDNNWRRIRVVVEVPVRGSYTEKDLRWAVERCIGSSAIKLSARGDGRSQAIGRAVVKEYGMVLAAQRRAARDAEIFQEARRTLQSLGVQISRMETLAMREEER